MSRNLCIVRMSLKTMSRNNPRKSPKMHSERPGDFMKNLDSRENREVWQVCRRDVFMVSRKRENQVKVLGKALTVLFQVKILSSLSRSLSCTRIATLTRLLG